MLSKGLPKYELSPAQKAWIDKGEPIYPSTNGYQKKIKNMSYFELINLIRYLATFPNGETVKDGHHGEKVLDVSYEYALACYLLAYPNIEE